MILFQTAYWVEKIIWFNGSKNESNSKAKGESASQTETLVPGDSVNMSYAREFVPISRM